MFVYVCVCVCVCVCAHVCMCACILLLPHGTYYDMYIFELMQAFQFCKVYLQGNISLIEASDALMFTNLNGLFMTLYFIVQTLHTRNISLSKDDWISYNVVVNHTSSG